MPSSVFDRLSQQGTAASAARAAKEKADREKLQRRRAEESAGVSPRHNRTKLQKMRAPQDPRLPVVRSPEQKDAFYSRLSKQETASSAAHHQLESSGPVGPKSPTMGNSEVFDRLYATGLKSPRKARHMTPSVAFPQPPLSPKRGKPPPSPGRRKRPETKAADDNNAQQDMEIKLQVLRLDEQLEMMESHMHLEVMEEGEMNAAKDAHEADTDALIGEEVAELQSGRERSQTNVATEQSSLDRSLQAAKDEYEARVRALEEQIAAMKTTHEEQLRSVQEENNSERIDVAAEGKEELTSDEAFDSVDQELERSGCDDWWR